MGELFMIETTYTNNLSKTLNNSGKKVMTVAGALLGASIANDNERVGYKVVNKQICDTKYHYRSETTFMISVL
jgi:uncharacterized protein YcfJ